MAISEATLLAHIYERSKGLGSDVLVGPGDDAAVVRVGTSEMLLTVDQFVEGRHFDPKSASVDWIARSAIGRSVSDIAAMGGLPMHAIVAATLGPNCPDPDALFDAMVRCANEMSVALVGGDIAMTKGQTVLGVTVVGSVHPTRGPVLRSGAQVGNGVYMTGQLGASAASGWTSEVPARIDAARSLCDSLGSRLTSMIDISDGLGRDGGRVALASGVSLNLDEVLLPVASGAKLEQAIGGGQDYELLFTASSDVPDQCDVSGVAFVRIGSVKAGKGCILHGRDGETRDISECGWDHTQS